MENLFDVKTRRFSQFLQLLFAEVMDVTQTFPSAPPIEQMIARFHLRPVNCRNIPRLDPRFEFFAVEELPVGMDEESVWSKELMDSVQNIQAEFTGWDVVQGGKTSDQ